MRQPKKRVFSGVVVSRAVPRARRCGSSGPPSVQSIAAKEHLTRVTDCGPGLEVTDSATAWRSGTKYGIDTFSTEQDRNAWLKVFKATGGTPTQMGTNWVVYQAETQTSAGCK